VTQEANAIGTAYLRVDLLPDDAQPELRRLFRRYTEVRAATYRDKDQSASARFLEGENQGAVEARLAEAAALQKHIWKSAVTAMRRSDTKAQATLALVQALNEMIDMQTTRVAALNNHVPSTILLFQVVGAAAALFLLSLYLALLSRGVVTVLLAAGLLTLLLFVTFDLTPSGSGTLLKMTESGFREMGWDVALLEQQYNDHVTGWDFYLPRLVSYVATAKVQR